MRRTLQTFVSSALTVACLLSLPGCGGGSSKGVNLTGTVVLPPALKLAEGENLQMSFQPEDESTGKAYAGAYTPNDNSFTAKEVPPGKYKITFAVAPYPGSQDMQARMATLKPFNAAFDKAHTPLNVEVKKGTTQKLTIDLVKKTVTEE
jgi:hypothetical protein